MIIRNAMLYRTDEKSFKMSDVMIDNGKFAKIMPNGKSDVSGEKTIDLNGKYMIPGFVDIHTHGAAGVEMIYAEDEEFIKISEHYAKHGVTTIFPTTMSTEHKAIMRMINAVNKARHSPELKINFEGVHVEGPYLSEGKRGAHNLNMLKPPNMTELDDILAATVKIGLNAHITIAPELAGAMDFIKKSIESGATISLGHTEASTEILDEAVANGAVSYTHLFNAMTPIHHRNAGVAGYALINDSFTEIICDGVHLCKEIVKLAYRAKGCEKIIIVSDSMTAAGLSDGLYGSGGRQVEVKNGKAVLKGTDTIVGSVANLHLELLNFMKFTGEAIENSLLTVTKNPCEAVGIYDRKGSIDELKDADFVILDKNYDIEAVYVNGKQVV